MSGVKKQQYTPNLSPKKSAEVSAGAGNVSTLKMIDPKDACQSPYYDQDTRVDLDDIVAGKGNRQRYQNNESNTDVKGGYVGL